jgi:hypothetical protein
MSFMQIFSNINLLLSYASLVLMFLILCLAAYFVFCGGAFSYEVYRRIRNRVNGWRGEWATMEETYI